MLSDDKQAKDVKRIDLIPDGWKKLLVDASVIGGRDPLVGSSNRKWQALSTVSVRSRSGYDDVKSLAARGAQTPVLHRQPVKAASHARQEWPLIPRSRHRAVLR